MKKENKKILEAKRIVNEAYDAYFASVVSFAKKQISRKQLKLAKEELAKRKVEVLAIKNEVPPKDYDPVLDFGLELEREKLAEVTQEQRAKLEELRADGEYKVHEIKDSIINIKLRKNISWKKKKELIAPLTKDFKEAKAVTKSKKNDVKALVKEANIINKAYGDAYKEYARICAHHANIIAEADFQKSMADEKAANITRLEGIAKKEKQFAKIEHKAKQAEIQRDYDEVLAKSKNLRHDAYSAVFSEKREITNRHTNIVDKFGLKWENYKYRFKVQDFLLKNSLYFVIIIFFILCAIVARTQGNPLLTTRTIETIFIQSSTKVFFSLGVAGLILLGGTDLSIGRMTGMAATFSCLIMSQLVYETNIGKIDMTIPQGVAVVLAIFVCMFSTTLFSAIAGFFTAKFKMHPFITTLSTQLLIYGLMMVCFSQVPAFTMDSEIKGGITGPTGLRLILYAVLVIIIVWFIWNKTKFGKNMYAVGDNKEAAAVSGINVFWVTMGVFIMAGVLYGLGGFLEGARIGNANPSTALGTELDAIAACVIGGISFAGGKGKVSGAVIGTIIFTTLTYCLTYIGLDINFQYIFKGIIIMAAVCLDSLKLIKKK